MKKHSIFRKIKVQESRKKLATQFGIISCNQMEVSSFEMDLSINHSMTGKQIILDISNHGNLLWDLITKVLKG